MADRLITARGYSALSCWNQTDRFLHTVYGIISQIVWSVASQLALLTLICLGGVTVGAKLVRTPIHFCDAKPLGAILWCPLFGVRSARREVLHFRPHSFHRAAKRVKRLFVANKHCQALLGQTSTLTGCKRLLVDRGIFSSFQLVLPGRRIDSIEKNPCPYYSTFSHLRP